MRILGPGDHHGVFVVRPSSQREISLLKAWPGCRWDPRSKAWQVPDDLLVCSRAAMPCDLYPTKHRVDVDPRLLPYQRRDVRRVLGTRYGVICYDTGLGKTATAVSILRNVEGPKLVLCPASLVPQWGAELASWWREDHGVVILSYGSTHKIPDERWGAIVVDESHAIKNARSGRGKAISTLARDHPRAVKVALSATPVANRGYDIWAQADFASPGRFSSWYRFVTEYYHTEQGDYGLEVGSLKITRQHEYYTRLGMLLCTKTKSDPDVRSLIREPVMDVHWSDPDCHDMVVRDAESFDLDISSRSAAKARTVASLVRAAPAGSRICVMTHLRSTAKAIAAEVGGIYASGDLTVKSRADKVESALRESKPLVATMLALGVGLDSLKRFDRVILAELYWSPGAVIQTLGRFNRIGSVGSTITIACHRGTIDERLVQVISDKLEESASDTYEAGALRSLLTPHQTIDEVLGSITATESRSEYGVA